MRTNNKFENPVICIAGQAPADTRIEIILTKIMIQRQIERFAILVQPLQMPQRTELVVSLQSNLRLFSDFVGHFSIHIQGHRAAAFRQTPVNVWVNCKGPATRTVSCNSFQFSIPCLGRGIQIGSPHLKIGPQNKPLSESCGAMYLIRTFSPSNWVWPSLVLVVSK